MAYGQITIYAARNWKPLVLAPLFLVAIIFFFFNKPETPSLPEGGIGGKSLVSEEVRRYEPLVREAAIKYGVEGYVELLLAKMQQESGGRGGDPMQSSESLGLPPNTINNPSVSIEVGVRYFSQVLKQAKGDVKLTLQAYNFGTGFIDYAKSKGGYSKETAIAFSEMMKKKTGWSNYGDVNYVDNVLRYFQGDVVVSSGKPNSYGFIRPVSTSITSRYGVRIDPFTGIPDSHFGVDFSCNRQAIPIYAANSGTVVKAGWQNPSNHREGFGQRVYVDHGSGLETVYAHLSTISVKPGQTVQRGQMIGKCGTTGSSTGYHLHLELHQNGARINPEGRIF
jgi:murein DD-endopeptidase MepM/ murein hydrolase activator NlpD